MKICTKCQRIIDGTSVCIACMISELSVSDILMDAFNNKFSQLLKTDPEASNERIQAGIDVLASISAAVSEHGYIKSWNARKATPRGCDCTVCVRIGKLMTERFWVPKS